MPLRHVATKVAPPMGLQCTGGSYSEGKRCVCPVGAEWNGSACGPGAPQPDTRHVTTVDLRQRR